MKTYNIVVVITESKRHPAYRVLSQVAELGPVRIAQIIPTVETPWRFRSKRPFWHYSGFGGGDEKHGRS